MKTKIFYLLLAFTTLCKAQIINIPDANFKAKLLQSSPTNNIARNINGIYFKIDSNNNNDYFAKIYKKNATLGESWNVTRPDGSIVTHEVVDIDSLVTVPAGSFHCKVFKYTTTTAVNESFVFWNDEVGNIMEDAGFFKLELKTHN